MVLDVAIEGRVVGYYYDHLDLKASQKLLFEIFDTVAVMFEIKIR